MLLAGSFVGILGLGEVIGGDQFAGLGGSVSGDQLRGQGGVFGWPPLGAVRIGFDGRGLGGVLDEPAHAVDVREGIGELEDACGSRCWVLRDHVVNDC